MMGNAQGWYIALHTDWQACICRFMVWKRFKALVVIFTGHDGCEVPILFPAASCGMCHSSNFSSFHDTEFDIGQQDGVDACMYVSTHRHC
jgi:hypothetical protein